MEKAKKLEKKQILLIAVWSALVICSRFLKFSLPINGHWAFGCFALIFPVFAYFFPSRLYLALGLGFLMHLVHPIPLTAGIPTFLATLSWKASKKTGFLHLALHAVLPLAAIALFICAPHAKQAWPYALYWLIPVLCLLGKTNLFKRALQSTFTAHATGSVIWAYFLPLSSAQWTALIPVVALERLASAVFAMAVITALSSVFNRKGGRKKSPQVLTVS